MKTAQCGCVISSAYLAGKLKYTRFIEANQKCAKASATAFRVGVAADYEFLLIEALEL